MMRSIRISIATIVTMLLCVGIIMIYSSSGVFALQNIGSKTYFLYRHLVFVGISCVAMLMVMAIDYRDLQKYAKPMILISLALLVLVLIPYIGKANFGARRWFKIGPINFQPSEFVKLAMIVYTADFLARKGKKIASFKEGFLPIMLVVGACCLLILKQPDFGNALLLGSIVFIMIFIAGANKWHLLSLGLMALPVLVYLVASKPYRMRRISAFLDPWADAQGVGFQLSQSQIAFGSGGMFGVGLGQSVQKLFYLPAAHTDFILSIIGEELGLIGSLAVVILFAAFIWQSARLAKRTTNAFGYYIAIGIITMLALQAVVNIGVSIGAFPTKGLPLPFVSYGGSALVFNCVAIGLLLNISRIEDL